MINKKFSLLLSLGILSLAACGEQAKPETDNKAEVAVEEQESISKGSMKKEDETGKDPVKEDSPEAKSGAASDLLSNNDMTRFVFNEPGEFSIFCEPHPVMQMTVLVEEGAEQKDEAAVNIADYKFTEETITVAPGTTITWTNQDQVQHNVAIK